MYPLFRFIVLFTLTVHSSRAEAQVEPLLDAAIAEQVRNLDSKNDKETRLAALKWLKQNFQHKNAAQAIPALERSIRDDPDRDVRLGSVENLGLIAHKLEKPCPVIICEAFLDKDESVRLQAEFTGAPFKTFAPGAVEVLMRGVAAENPDIRSACILVAARAAGKDKKVLEAIEKGKQDKQFSVRHNSHIACYVANNNVEDLLLWFIRMHFDNEAVLAPIPDNPEQAKQDRTTCNLGICGAIVRMVEWSNERPEELAQALVKLLDDKSPDIRSGAADWIGAALVKVEMPAKPLDLIRVDDKSLIMPYLDYQAAFKPNKDGRLEKSKVASQLEKFKAGEKLRKLRDNDPNRLVRDHAATALKRWALLNEQKP